MKRALTATGVLVGLALLASSAQAQSGGARGKVTDEKGQPVAEATVRIEYTGGIPRTYEVKTNDKGEYVQIGLRTGNYHFTASKEGYVDATLDIRVGLGMATQIPTLELISKAAAQTGPDAAAIKEKFAKGTELARNGQLDEAEALFLGLLQEQPGIPEIHRNLGYVYAQKKDWTNSEMQYQSALDLRPGEPDFVAALAQMYKDSGQEEKAMELLSQATADNPEDASTQFNRGIFLLDGDQSEEAAVAFEAALAADPSMEEAHYHLGTILVGQGKIPESIEHLEAYLAASPTNEQNKATAEGLLAALKQ